ncbi:MULTISPECIES: prephenate dehydrogenase/arogenate dehydrogenase family protein [unclassified Methylophaga]|jgi:prephenate dehydrogenase|uniref:prephenate dehydrogenase n=2 Tax=Methylophaga TaxID=40222 RepID=UPI000C89C622|nr:MULTISPECIES: prephenate dehydrogenase/arogenate dehydrogenase family protein [unclassified Methylophaga]MAK67224.1 prephenate dehydrogenase [Methylophaga sp.]MAY18262.1 prephenate dehydrogenase [Methylophaga sp.]MBN47307.1 prephenate dehydrogenase [Methylophaga sp.]HAO25365.1 prephenate dehydrogenase/arogenate dehydrogenase family protein [Methylophaga sp.]|tara:strand:- start:2087 stop:2974 length:888 start_codon:yes stop_codon:yes gene_type:complete
MIKKLAIIGVGLIGGSLALALKKAGLVEQVTGYSRSAAARDEALALGIIDNAADSLKEAVADADMVFVAVPMGAMQTVFEQMAPHLKSQAIVTDAGSAKHQVVEAARRALGDKFDRFVPGHPIAGTEKSGPSAAFAELYQQHRVVLTPVAETDKNALEQVRQMWQQAGADVFDMEVEHHDVVLAATSHLPHVLAFNLVGMLSKRDDCDEVLRYAAGGFRDFSRIASSDAVMWRDICLGNRHAILELLEQYRRGLDQIEQAIRQDDGDYLIDIFARAKRARDTRFADPSLKDNSEV